MKQETSSQGDLRERILGVLDTWDTAQVKADEISTYFGRAQYRIMEVAVFRAMETRDPNAVIDFDSASEEIYGQVVKPSERNAVTMAMSAGMRRLANEEPEIFDAMLRRIRDNYDKYFEALASSQAVEVSARGMIPKSYFKRH
jgi:hypothetical protein